MEMGGRKVDEILGERILKNVLLNSSACIRTSYVHGLKDIATPRAFLTGNSIIALFDAHWLLFFTLITLLFHPLDGQHGAG